jgi:hypothetical protein
MEYITYLKFNWHSKLIGFEENGWLGMKYKTLEHLKHGVHYIPEVQLA